MDFPPTTTEAATNATSLVVGAATYWAAIKAWAKFSPSAASSTAKIAALKKEVGELNEKIKAMEDKEGKTQTRLDKLEDHNARIISIGRKANLAMAAGKPEDITRARILLEVFEDMTATRSE